MRTVYRERIKIPLCNVEYSFPLYSKSGTLLLFRYSRILVDELAGRGPYVEINNLDVNWKNFYIPKDKKWKINSEVDYYEWRSRDASNVKLYMQKRSVDYADYYPYLNYVSPFELYTKEGVVLIDKIRG